MSLQSFAYFAFLPPAAAICFVLPEKWQNRFLLLASAFFYWKALPGDPAKALLTVAFVLALWAFVYGMGRAIGAAGPGSEPRKKLVRTGVIVLLAALAVFKYWNLSPLPTLFAGSALARLPFPLGISFFTFAAIGYLVDVGRGDCEAEQSPVNMGVFLFFFGTITSGPICRGGKLLPQLHTRRRFDAARTVNALRLFAFGLFKKVALADVLGLFVNQVFADLSSHGGPALLLAVVAYTWQLYFDFSGYSDMARASGLLLGIELPENFKTPFYATNFSGFWNRWHISLSGWLQDYLFMPLVWADTGRLTKGKLEHLPAEFCVFCVFFASGFWHGNTMPYVVWGLMQAAYRVGEEVAHRKLGKPKKKAPARVLWGKRLGVFLLWSLSMVFFRIGSGSEGLGIGDGFACIAGFFRGWSPARFAGEVGAAIRGGFYDNTIMVVAYLAMLAVGFILCLWLDSLRFNKFKSKPTENVIAALPTAQRWVLYYALVLLILAGLIIQNGGFGGGVSFSYANF